PLLALHIHDGPEGEARTVPCHLHLIKRDLHPRGGVLRLQRERGHEVAATVELHEPTGEINGELEGTGQHLRCGARWDGNGEGYLRGTTEEGGGFPYAETVQRNDHLLGLRQRAGCTAQNHAP